MRIAVSAAGQTCDSQLHPQFGRCPWLLFVDTDTRACEPVANICAELEVGAGIGVSQVVADHGVDAVLSGDVGPKAYEVLTGAGITIYRCPPGITVDQAIDRLQAGALQPLQIRRF